MFLFSLPLPALLTSFSTKVWKYGNANPLDRATHHFLHQSASCCKMLKSRQSLRGTESGTRHLVRTKPDNQ